MASLSEIKNWFKTGLKPTQTQFWITWDSFWHKDTLIPQSAIENLEEALASVGSGGERFGIEDNASSEDRTIDMNANKFNFNNVSEFNIGGKSSSNVLIPYDENTMYFTQTNNSGDVSLDGKSLMYIYKIPIEGDEIEVYFTVDGSSIVRNFTLSSENGRPVWITTEIEGDEVIPLDINSLMDVSEGNLEFSELKIKSKGAVVFVNSNENMWFNQHNSYSDIPSWDGKSIMGVEPVYKYDISEYPETITARLRIDGVISDMIFTLDVQYSADWNQNIYCWTRPEIEGNDFYLIGIHVVDHSTKVYMSLPNTEYAGQKIIVKDSDGTLNYTTLDNTSPNIDQVLTSGSYANNKTITLNRYDGEENLLLAPDGISIGYRSSDYTIRRQSALSVESLSFYYASTDTNLNQRIIPNYNQGSANTPVEVTMPVASGHMLLKNGLPKLIHRSIPTTNTTMNSTQWSNLLEPAVNFTVGDYQSLENTIVYNGTANATWVISPDSFIAWKYRIINNTAFTITINRTGTTTLWIDGTSNTSIVIPAKGWADIIGSNSENRFYFKIN